MGFWLVSADDWLTYFTLKWWRKILPPRTPPLPFFTVSLAKVSASSPQIIQWEEDGPLVSYSLLFLDSSVSQNHQECLLKCRLLGSMPRVPDSVDLEWDVKFHVLNKFPGDADFPGDHILRITVLKKWYFRKLFQHYIITWPPIISAFFC